MKIYAKCPPTKCEYLTGGKEYEVLDEDGKAFHITDNAGDKVVEKWIDGLHAKGDWERIIREDVGDNALTIRDEFALAALPSVIDAMGSIVTPSKVADISYQYADAMMEARKP